MKEILRLAGHLNWRQAKGAARLFTRHPLLFSTAIPATAKCISICNRLFGSAHHRDNQTNAFRHALWNMLLMKYALSAVNTVEEAEAWAANFTHWYEAFSPNPPLPRAMDLHNNRIGRELFCRLFKNQNPDPQQISQALLPLLDKAVRIRNIEELEAKQDLLVYITD